MIRTCVICGREFETTRHKALSCSDECRHQQNLKYQAEYRASELARAKEEAGRQLRKEWRRLSDSGSAETAEGVAGDDDR